MLYKILLAVIILPSFAAAVFAQEAVTEPSPSPKPAVKRRGLDQWGLSNGVRLPASSSRADSSESPTEVEPVTQSVFTTIYQIGESASFLESELARALEENAEISARSPFGKFFRHRIEGIYRLSETHRFTRSACCRRQSVSA